jgi:thymidine phosphorylase
LRTLKLIKDMSSNFSDDAISIIEAFLIDSNDQTMSDLTNYCKEYDLSDSEIIFLAKALAESGTTINFSGENICDIPSTGGPSSLSTLLCPLFLKLLGNKILKLGVPGRPAGGIDVLSQIEGYNINPDLSEVEEWFTTNGYVHFLANQEFTPLDSKLFSYRKNNNSLDVPCLVIASLLSKKIAVGLNIVGLDVRVGKFGNFGRTLEEARKNSIRFVRVAALVGINAKCFITNSMMAQQPYIGRGEALLALYKIFTKQACTHLEEHLSVCLEMSLSISGEKSINFTTIDIENAFIENIEVQGGNKESFYTVAANISRKHIYNIYAAASGFLSIDLYKIRDVIVSMQSDEANMFSDTCGVILKARSGHFITEGAIICSYRYELDLRAEFEIKLNSAFNISENTEFLNIEIITDGKI